MFIMRLAATLLVVCFCISGFTQDPGDGAEPESVQDPLGLPSGKVDQVELFSAQDSINYFFGLTLGYSMEGITFETDPALIAVGLYTAMTGNSSHGMETARMIVEDIIQRMLNAKLDSAYTIPEDNLVAGKEFLKENATKEGIHTTESGLQYEVIIEGNGPKPGPTDTVNVHYEGMFIDGEVFDSSFERGNPTSFPLPMVIAGWREGLQLMPVGSTYKFFVPSPLAYGPRRTGPIPPNSVLIFRITLLGIQ
jgi:FKBP-type peptidyl-prolyl cis-trans isomerase